MIDVLGDRLFTTWSVIAGRLRRHRRQDANGWMDGWMDT